VGAALAAGLLLAPLTACAPAERTDPPPAGDATRGAALFAIAGGCGCHTPEQGPVGAGGVAIATPFGTFYSTNVTSDRATGIGAWSDAEIERAIRQGTLPDGAVETPVMPYYEYAGLADADVRDLIAYLRTLPAAAQRNRAHEPTLPFPRLAYRGWRLLYGPRAAAPATAPTDGVERGRYLTDHVAICGDCHTPRTRFGALDASLYLAGTDDGPGDEVVPNITPDPATGIATWSADDIANLLATGFKPDFDNVQGSMAHVIDGVAGGPGYARAPAGDLRAIAAYMKTVPAIPHAVHAKDDAH
jgi:mono/diheme cytochrome c family protein